MPCAVENCSQGGAAETCRYGGATDLSLAGAGDLSHGGARPELWGQVTDRVERRPFAGHAGAVGIRSPAVERSDTAGSRPTLPHPGGMAAGLSVGTGMSEYWNVGLGIRHSQPEI